MSPSDRELAELIQRRVANLTPDQAVAFARAIRNAQQILSVAEIEARIRAGLYDRLFTELELNTAFTPVDDQIQRTVERAFSMAAKDIPGAIVQGSKMNIMFDVLNPRVTKAIEGLQTRTIETLKESVQQTVRETVSRRLALGHHPTAIARELRPSIGMAPHQVRWVENFEAQLRAGDVNALKRQLVQDRTSVSLLKILQSGKLIPEARITSAVAAYRKAVISMNSSLNTRAAALDSYRLAQWEAYASAIDRGIIDKDEAEKVWVHYEFQEHPREDHLAWNGLVVPFDQTFPDGQQQAGLGYFNCRCFTRYRIRRQQNYPRPLAA